MIALLANPDSGSGEADEVERMLRDHGCDVARFGLDEGDRAVAAKPERVVVAGGDGSVGRAADIAVRARVPLAVVAVGTANDFARAMELPRDLGNAVTLAADGRSTTRLDLGRASGRPFVNVVSAGLSPVAARKSHGLKTILGPLAYTVGALQAGLFAEPVRCAVDVDRRRRFDGEAWQVTVGLTGAFGGGAEVEADPTDGALDLVVIQAGARLRLLRHAYGLRASRVEGQQGVITASGHRVEVRVQGEEGFNLDGELVEDRELELTVEPHAFEIVVGP